MRRSIYISDDLWKRVNERAADEGAKEGRPLPASEWIRRIIEKELGPR